MFEYIFGELTIKKIDYVAIDINGLAYKIFISLKTFETLKEIGEDEKLYIHTHVKEDDISFYGFKTENERELFRELIIKDVINIVLDNNSKLFTKVPGLGEKKAQKIILDLKDKVKKLNIIEIQNENEGISNGKNIISDTSNTKLLLMKEDIKLALESLGYVNADVSKWIKDEELADMNNIGDAIKTILQKIQNKK